MDEEMKENERLKNVGELVVKAPLEALRKAARVTLGITVREIREDGKIIFTYDSPLCHPE